MRLGHSRSFTVCSTAVLPWTYCSSVKYLLMCEIPTPAWFRPLCSPKALPCSASHPHEQIRSLSTYLRRSETHLRLFSGLDSALFARPIKVLLIKAFSIQHKQRRSTHAFVESILSRRGGRGFGLVVPGHVASGESGSALIATRKAETFAAGRLATAAGTLESFAAGCAGAFAAAARTLEGFAAGWTGAFATGRLATVDTALAPFAAGRAGAFSGGRLAAAVTGLSAFATGKDGLSFS